MSEIGGHRAFRRHHSTFWHDVSHMVSMVQHRVVARPVLFSKTGASAIRLGITAKSRPDSGWSHAYQTRIENGCLAVLDRLSVDRIAYHFDERGD